LATVETFTDLLGIQAAVPPNKAAFTAVYKDPATVLKGAMDCGLPSDTCIVEDYKSGLIYGFEDDKIVSVTPPTVLAQNCQKLREGWINYGTNDQVPADLWISGQPSFCQKGPIQHVGAVWPVDSAGSNVADMRDVNAGWYLPGAVYECCSVGYSCFV
jgi:hypothetical protein